MKNINRITPIGSVRSLFLILLAIIIVCEIGESLFLKLLPPLSFISGNSVDAVLLILLLFPLFYYFIFRPYTILLSDRKKVEEALHRNTHYLGERVKELHCLYTISELVRKEDIAQETIWQECTTILAQAYMFHDIAACRITVGGKEYNTVNFRKTAWSQSRDIIVQGDSIGTVEVHYLDERPEEYEGPFLIEEGKLITAVAELLGKSTERKRSEEQLRQLSQLVEQSPLSIVITDTTGSIEYVNPKFVEASGYSYDEAVGKNPRILKTDHTSPEEYRQLWKILLAGGEWHGEFQNKKKNGTLYWESVTISPIINGRGETTHYLAMKEDITDLKHSREQTRLQQMQLIQADKMKSLGVLVSGIAHEINNPNNLVMFNSDLVSRIIGDVTPGLNEYYEDHPERLVGGLSYSETLRELESLLKGISIGSQRIRDSVVNLKNFARIDSGNMNQQMRINEIVKSALLIVANLVAKSSNAFSVSYADNLPAIAGNAQQIEQVIINLLANACQALQNTSQAIHLSTKYDEAGKRIHVVVSDEGIGISKGQVKQIFDPFFTTKIDTGGTGLGLSISDSIVQAHKGELWVQSVEGKGTTVTMVLPVGTFEAQQ